MSMQSSSVVAFAAAIRRSTSLSAEEAPSPCLCACSGPCTGTVASEEQDSSLRQKEPEILRSTCININGGY